MAKPRNQRKPTKEMQQNQEKQPQKPEKPPSWAVVRGIFTCKNLQAPPPQQQQQEQQQQEENKQKQRQKQKQKQKQQQEQASEETSKKCKKMKCSGSLCSNTKVMHRPETAAAASPELQRKRASMGSSSKNESSSRSMKIPLHEINGNEVLSSTNSSLSSSSFTNGGMSFRGMPFRRFSGCYECRMVVDPVLGIARDPSLRGSICSCPECGEIFMKPENLELHQVVRHAGTSIFNFV